MISIKAGEKVIYKSQSNADFKMNQLYEVMDSHENQILVKNERGQEKWISEKEFNIQLLS